jgi:methionyl-tRNA formyltransferase
LFGKLCSKFDRVSSVYEKAVTHPVDFSEGVAAYEAIPKSLIHLDCDVRDKNVHDELRLLQPDVAICLGGPVYPKGFIDAFPLTLNFHSGISPFYNGTASIQFAFANGHLRLCGGTLMTMSAAIDGGQVLGHYLPAIEEGDTPTALFSKTVQGAAQMYTQILKFLQAGKGGIQSISQPAPLFYTTNFQMGWYHRAMTVRNLQAGVPAGLQRPESIIEYWREKDPGKGPQRQAPGRGAERVAEGQAGEAGED